MHFRSYTTLLQMRLAGDACPIAPHLIALAEQDDQFAYPPSYRLLLETWGIGHLLGDHIRLLDPTNRHDTSDWVRWKRHLEDASLTPCHDRPYLVDPWVLQTLVVFAIGPRFALAWDIYSGGDEGEYHIWVLHDPGLGGQTRWIASSLNEAIALFLGEDAHEVLPPAPTKRWEFEPIYGTLQTTTEAYVQAIVEALLAHQESRAWRLLDDALLIVPKCTMHQALMQRLGPQLPGAPCALPINQTVYHRWLLFLCKSIRADLPHLDPPRHIQTAVDELESRTAKRVLFDLEADCPLKVLARIRRHASKPIILEIFLAPHALTPLEPGTLTLCELDASGDLQGQHTIPITPNMLSKDVASIWSIRGIHPAARLDLLYTPEPPTRQDTALWGRSETTRA